MCIGINGCHSTRVHSFIKGCAEYWLTLPQLPYVPNLATYVFLSDLTDPVSLSRPPTVSERNIFITGTAVSVIRLIHCHLLTKLSLTKVILVAGDFGMTSFFSLL